MSEEKLQQHQKPLPVRFDPVNFADHSRELEGPIATKGMLRLRDNVVASDDMVFAKLSFSRGLHGYPLVAGQAKASVTMRCERCLDNVQVELNPEINVLVKPEDELLPQKEDNIEDSRENRQEDEKDADRPDIHDYDGKSLVLSDLVEEELLLALPLVPKHQDISLCNQDMVAWLAANEAPGEGQDTPTERVENPFAILKKR